jgi:hypothetical protein
VISISEGFVENYMIFAKKSSNTKILIVVLIFDENFACFLLDVILPKLLLFPNVVLTNFI